MKEIKSSIVAKVVEITPADAQILKDSFLQNRPTNKDAIVKYSKQMLEGKWELNGGPIIVDAQGHCENGYHRLSACILANVPFTTLLVTGVGHETWTTVDTGKTRSIGDIFVIAGITNGTAKSTLVTKFHALTQGLNGIADSGSLHRIRRSSTTRKDLLKIYHKYDTQFNKILSIVGKYSPHLKGVVTPSMIGSILAYLHIIKGYPLTRLEEFLDKMVSSGLNVYVSGRIRLKEARGFEKQKIVCDMWNKFKSDRERVRVCIVSVSGIFE